MTVKHRGVTWIWRSSSRLYLHGHQLLLDIGIHSCVCMCVCVWVSFYCHLNGFLLCCYFLSSPCLHGVDKWQECTHPSRCRDDRNSQMCAHKCDLEAYLLHGLISNVRPQVLSPCSTNSDVAVYPKAVEWDAAQAVRSTEEKSVSSQAVKLFCTKSSNLTCLTSIYSFAHTVPSVSDTLSCLLYLRFSFKLMSHIILENVLSCV